MASLPQPPCPNDKTTLVGMDTASALCSTFLAPNVLTGVFLRLLQEHFSKPENLIYNGASEVGKKQLEGYIWDEDNAKTRIQIQSVWRYNAQDIQRRPALYVKRNQWTTQRIAIDDGQSARGVSRDSINIADPAPKDVVDISGAYHSKLILGSHTIFCVGSVGEGAEAELLGAEVFDYLQSFAPILRGELKLLRLEVQSLEPIGMLDEATEHYVVPVVVAYGFSWTWRITAKAPWLKSLAIELRSN